MVWKGDKCVLFLDNTLMTFNQLKKKIEVEIFSYAYVETNCSG